jgi:carboxylesterase type B
VCFPLSADPRMLAAAGKAADVPVIYGFNADEGTVFNKCPTDLPTSEYFSFLNETYGEMCLGCAC